MKQLHSFLLAILLAIVGVVSMQAETVDNYVCDFNTPINTSTHYFKVASNWKHIVDKYTDDDGIDYYMNYSYKESDGIDGSGSLLAYNQYVGDGYGASGYIWDLLVTPVVSGHVTLKAKRYTSGGYVTIFSLNEACTAKADQLYTIKDDLSDSEFITIDLDVETPQRLGIRACYVYLDDFTAEHAEIEIDKSIQIVSAEPKATTGTIYWDQQPDGTVLVKYTVTVKNDGECKLVANSDNKYCISIVNGKNNNVVGRTKVPFDLEIGETSEPFDVTATIPAEDVATYWPNGYTYVKMNLREELGGVVTERAQSHYKEYAAKMYFRAKGSTSASNISGPLLFGQITEALTNNYEVYNEGNAPLLIKSLTLPEGYTSDWGNEEVTILPKEKRDVAITLPVDVRGSFSGDLKIVYVAKGTEESTYTIGLSGSVIGANTYTCDFGNSNDYTRTDGSVAGTGISGDYNGYGAARNNYIKGSANNNYFITPLLHAQAGEALGFSAKREYSGSSYYLNVYVTKDRNNYGDPVKVITPSDLGDSNWHTESITIQEEGDYYVVFKPYGILLDDIVGLETVDVAHDLYIQSFSYQRDTVQKGVEISANITTMALTDEAENDYKIEFFLNDEKVGEAAAPARTAHWKNSSSQSVKVTPDVDQTVVWPGYFKITYNDGSFVTSETKDIKITCEPYFVFFNKGASEGNVWNAPSNRTTPITFGKINEYENVQNFEIFNYGAAPLTVKSITVPEGYTVNVTEGTVAPKERLAVDITFSAREFGTYAGDLQIVYVDAEGVDQTFKLAVSGTLLDPDKMYITFDGPSTSAIAWPAGSLYQTSVSNTRTGTPYSYKIYCSSSKTANAQRLFITPKVHVEAGETLSFDMALYSSFASYAKGGVTVFAAPTREGLENADERIEVIEVAGDKEDASLKVEQTYKTFVGTFPETGDYYLGFSLFDGAYLDDIVGGTIVPVEHDWVLQGVNVPTTATQNTTASGSVSLSNIGLNPEVAGEYQVTAYVNGEAQVADGTVDVAVVNTLKATDAKSIPVYFRSPKKGTFPVYFEVSAGDYKVATEPVEVAFSEEVLSAEKQVGERDSWSTSYPFTLNNRNSEMIALYSPTELGLNDGDKISKIVIKGYSSSYEWDTNVVFGYQLVDETTLAKPDVVSGYDYKADGIVEYYSGTKHWEKAGSATAPIDMITLDFDQPLVYESGKSLKLYFKSTSSSYKSGFNFELSKAKNAYFHTDDNTNNTITAAWGEQKKPVLHLDMVVEARSLSGNVTDGEGAAVEGAVVTLISNDGDNVQYETTTDAEGNYSVNVIQSGREYDVEVAGEDMMEFDNNVSFADASQERDFTLRPVIVIADDREHSRGAENAVVYLNTVFNEGFNAVALPIALDAEEVADIFGEDAIVMEWDGDSGEAAVNVNFAETHNGMEAGVPYLLWLSEDTKPIRFVSKEVVETFSHRNGTAVNFKAAAAPTPLAEGMFVLTEDNFVPANNKMREAQIIPAYHAYVEANNANVKSLTFTTDANIETAVEEIEGVAEGEDMIYTIDGIRVKNPAKGLYIVNGKMVIVK